MANTFKPSKGVSTRHIPADDTDRKKMNDTFKERKANQEKIKNERFDKILAERKSFRAGKREGINIEVTGNSD